MERDLIQEKIRDIFYNYFKEYSGGNRFSRPHIPFISEAYLTNRILILGQETNTWYNYSDDDLFNEFIKKYDPTNVNYGTEHYQKFISEASANYRGKFWEFNRKLYQDNILQGSLNENGSLSHCWMNLFTIESCINKSDKGGRPTVNRIVREKVLELQKDLVFEVINVLKPKMIIALTGHSLDDYLLNYGLKLKDSDAYTLSNVDSYGIFGKHQIGEIKTINLDHSLYGTKILRIYHPSYFLGRINANKRIKMDLRDKGIEIPPSKVYLNTIFKWIERNI